LVFPVSNPAANKNSKILSVLSIFFDYKKKGYKKFYVKSSLLSRKIEEKRKGGE
jgi:hypothetical protein